MDEERFWRKGKRTVNTTAGVTVMTNIQHYTSPLGELLMAADEGGLTGLWFAGQKYFAGALSPDWKERETPVLLEAKRWLDVYFFGRAPEFTPPLHLTGTPFRCAVWELLRQIPYGQTTTYGALAQLLTGGGKMSAQAVGGAVGHNPISIIIPCHRVVGADGSLTGYAAGLDKKIALLALERAEICQRRGPDAGVQR